MKKLFVTFAVAGLVLASCSTNEETAVSNVQNPGVINFSATTTRAAIGNLSTLTGDAGGFKVYGASASNTTAWYGDIDGTNNYAYTAGAWGWGALNPAPQWPTDVADYPMNFYALYPDVAMTTETPATVLSKDITIASTAATQVDMLAAKATASAKPAGGALSMTFNHILSKVNFGVIAGDGMTPEIQAVAMNVVHNTNTYNYISGAWGGSTSTAVSYDYFRNLTTMFTTTGVATEDVAVPLYTAGHSNNLMLMPQVATGQVGSTGAPAAWDKTQADLTAGAHIEVIYRITNASGDYIGYTDANDYLVDFPATPIGPWGIAPNDFTGIGNNAGEYDGRLYIRVGFPVTVTWTPGKGYTYNICLGTAGSTNGYYVDDTYYDEHGQDTGIPIEGKDIGNPVTDGTINFLIDVNNWDDTTPAIPLQ